MSLVKSYMLTGGALPRHLDRQLRMWPARNHAGAVTDEHGRQVMITPPAVTRQLIIARYEAGLLTWAECYKELFNAGFRGAELRF